MIRFTDPDGEHRITDVEAVERQRAAGRRQGFEYPSDEAALTDFMMIHWAWKDGATGWPKHGKVGLGVFAMKNWKKESERLVREDGLIVEYWDRSIVGVSFNDRNMTLDEWLALYSEFKGSAAKDPTLRERLRHDLNHSERVGSRVVFTFSWFVFEPTTESLWAVAGRVDGLVALRTPKQETPVDETKALKERVAQLEAEVAELKQWMRQCRA